ncbi:GntR family transcriptional regulator [Bordetella petrii]|nr:GntR family transcriptional regulator [Bordetella petrii]
MNNPMFNPVKASRIFEDICDQIRVQLATGVLKPGDKLPGERDLAAAFGVGRPSVREALRTLEISGIITLQKGAKGGAFICNGETRIMTKALHDFMLLGRISFENLKEARVHIWGLVVRLACQRGTAEDFDNIEKHIDYIQGITDVERRTLASVELFNLVAAASHNEAFVLLVEALGEIVIYVTEKSDRVLFPELPPLRLQLLQALRSRDEAAAIRVMEEYLSVVHRQLKLK